MLLKYVQYYHFFCFSPALFSSWLMYAKIISFKKHQHVYTLAVVMQVVIRTTLMVK